jgi:hypothetical protein
MEGNDVAAEKLCRRIEYFECVTGWRVMQSSHEKAHIFLLITHNQETYLITYHTS